MGLVQRKDRDRIGAALTSCLPAKSRIWVCWSSRGRRTFSPSSRKGTAPKLRRVWRIRRDPPAMASNLVSNPSWVSSSRALMVSESAVCSGWPSTRNRGDQERPAWMPGQARMHVGVLRMLQQQERMGEVQTGVCSEPFRSGPACSPLMSGISAPGETGPRAMQVSS